MKNRKDRIVMKKEHNAVDLRKRAEMIARLRRSTAEDTDTQAPEEIQQTLHELRVRQIELEMQTEELRQAQTELEAARARYFDLYDMAPVGYVTLSEKGLILESNLTACTLLDVPRSELAKKPLSSFILKEDQDIYYRLRKKLFETGKPQKYELRMVKKNNEAFWAHLEAAVAQDAYGPAVCRVAISDITERKSEENVLRERAEFLHVIVAKTPDFIFIQDRELRYSYVVNPQLGLTESDMIGKTDYDFLTKDEADNLTKIKRQVIETGRPHNYSISLTSKAGYAGFFDGTYVPRFDANGGVNGLIGYFRDINEKKQSEDALKVSEKKYWSIFQNASIGIFHTLPKGEVLRVNPALTNMFRYESPEEMIATVKDIASQIYVDSEKRSGLIASIMESNDLVCSEYRLRRKDGTIMTAIMAAHKITKPDGTMDYLEGFIEDITERRLAEEALKISEQQYRTLVEGSGNFILCIDEKGEYKFINQAYASAFGKTPDYFIGKTIWDVFPEEQADQRYEIVKRVFETGESESLEMEVPLPDKTLYFYAKVNPIKDATGKVIQALVDSTDITARKRMEEALREREERLSSIYNTVADVIFHLEADANGEYHFASVNESFYRITGLSREQIVGKKVSEVLPESSLPIVADKYQEAIETKTIVRWEEVSDYPTGRLTAEVSVVPVFNGKGQCTHLVGSAHDITMRKQIEEALRAREERLNKTQEIAHIGSWELDLATKHLIWSDEMYRILGIQPQKFDDTYEAFLDMVHPDDRAAVDAVYSNSLQEGRDIHEIEHRIVRRQTQEVRYVLARFEHVRDASARVIRSVGMLQDITDRKKADEISVLSNRLSQILNNLDAIIYVTDLKTYEVVFINTYAQYIWGDIQGMICWQTIQTGQAGPCKFCTNDQLLGTDGKPTEGVVWEFQNTVNKRWYSCRDKAIDWPDGRIVRIEIATDITEKKEMMAELENSYKQLRVLNRRWAEVEELERKRLSAELHDEIGQNMTALGINFGIVKMSLPPGIDSSVNNRIDDSINLLKRSTAHIKNIMSNLRPALLDDYGLVPALNLYAQESAKRTRSKISFAAEELPCRPSAEIETALFRIAQEAVNNAVKHARAKHIRLTIKHAENKLFLVIADDGIGFDKQVITGQDFQGWGSMIIQERCIGVKGTCRIESKPNQGTKISVEVPL